MSLQMFNLLSKEYIHLSPVSSIRKVISRAEKLRFLQRDITAAARSERKRKSLNHAIVHATQIGMTTVTN